MNDKEQVNHCQAPDFGHPSRSYNDAEKRMAKGQGQTFCTVCERWVWPDKECRLFESWNETAVLPSPKINV